MRKQIYRVLFAIWCVLLFSSFAVAQKSRASVSASEVNGTFRYRFHGKFKGSSSDVKILALGHGRLRVAFDLVYPHLDGQGELTANLGQLDGEAKIEGDLAVYSSTEFGNCTITIKFVSPGTIKVSQAGSDNDCGFGHNVTSDGTYKKISSIKPKFDTNK